MILVVKPVSSTSGFTPAGTAIDAAVRSWDIQYGSFLGQQKPIRWRFYQYATSNRFTYCIFKAFQIPGIWNPALQVLLGMRLFEAKDLCKVLHV